MLTQLTRNWWAVALRGGVAILYGVLALVWPRAKIEILVLFFGVYMFLDWSICDIRCVYQSHRA